MWSPQGQSCSSSTEQDAKQTLIHCQLLGDHICQILTKYSIFNLVLFFFCSLPPFREGATHSPLIVSISCLSSSKCFSDTYKILLSASFWQIIIVLYPGRVGSTHIQLMYIGLVLSACHPYMKHPENVFSFAPEPAGNLWYRKHNLIFTRVSHSILCGVDVWEIWMQRADGVNSDWQKVSQTMTRTAKVQKHHVSLSSSWENINVIQAFHGDTFWICCVMDLWSLPYICLASAFPQEDLLPVHYNKENTFVWAGLLFDVHFPRCQPQ